MVHNINRHEFRKGYSTTNSSVRTSPFYNTHDYDVLKIISIA